MDKKTEVRRIALDLAIRYGQATVANTVKRAEEYQKFLSGKK